MADPAAGRAATASALNLILDEPVHAIALPHFVRDHTSLLGSGGFGVVRRGELDGIPVALKIMHAADFEAQRKIYREAQLQQRVRDPRVVAVYGVLTTQEPQSSGGGEVVIVMELCEGGSLSQKLHGGGPCRYAAATYATFPLRERIRLLWQMAGLLARLHSPLRVRGPYDPATGFIVHGDIKPANIMLSAAVLGTPKLGDFGLASLRDSEENHTIVGPQRGAGTAEYLHPSLCQLKDENTGVVTAAAGAYTTVTDLYAFAVVMTEVLSGEKPFRDLREASMEDVPVRSRGGVGAGAGAGVVPAAPSRFFNQASFNRHVLGRVIRLGKRPDIQSACAACADGGMSEEVVRVVREILIRLLRGDLLQQPDVSGAAVEPRDMNAAELHEKLAMVHASLIAE